jgi:hypothetical protein
MSAIAAKVINHLEKGFGVFRRDHRFKEFSFAVGALKVATATRDTDCRETVLVERNRVVIIRNSARNRKGKLVPEMGSSKPEGFGLEFI